MDWKKESELFDQVADDYDTFRPGYPMEIIDTIIRTTGIDEHSRLLEIGAGSGKATTLFAPFHLNIDCVDPGVNLVRNGRIKFAAFENIRFHAGRFEELELPSNQYDVVFSAQAFHWIPQPIGYEKCARILKDQGYLALFWNMYITHDTALDRELVQLSDQQGGFADFLSAGKCEERIASISSTIKDSGYFHAPDVYRVLWKQTYTAEAFFGFVKTGNGMIKKTAEEKMNAYLAIQELAARHGGMIVRPYLCVLYLASRL